MEFIQQNILLFFLAASSLGGFLFLTQRQAAAGGDFSLSPLQATLLINHENAIIIDLREPDAYASGHLPESRNIPEARLDERMSELRKLKASPILLLCQTGVRATIVRARFEKEEFAKIHTLNGGISAWSASGLPLKRGAKK